jgi:NADH-quinone oxidoreductase subunit H
MWGETWNWAEWFTQLQVSLGAPEMAAWFVTYFVGAFILVNASLVLALLLIWITRKVVSRLQDRIGPNRVGPYGLIQSVADALKLLSKEAIMPRNADWISYNLAPILSVFGVLMALAVIAFAPGFIGADLSVGVLYIPALGSIGIMAALMAGWASNNKYALLAGFRVVAQLLSYEVPMVLAMLPAVLLAGSMSMQALTEAQSLDLFGLNFGLGWNVFVVPGAFLIFLIASLAEAEQPPFDLLEAESELIAGFHIEYSGMRFAMFFLAQFLNTFFLGAIATILFLGGWQGPFVDQLPMLGFVYFFIKTMLVYLLVMWMKGTLPRVRIDQMMHLAWKVLVPLVLALILWQMIAMQMPGGTLVQYPLILLGNLLVIWVVARMLDSHFKREMVRTKRAFEPTSLIGTMQPVADSSGD